MDKHDIRLECLALATGFYATKAVGVKTIVDMAQEMEEYIVSEPEDNLTETLTGGQNHSPESRQANKRKR